MSYKTTQYFVVIFLTPILIIENIATCRIKTFCGAFVVHFDVLMHILISTYFEYSSDEARY